jgi:thiamine pyrophosphokinase
VAAGASRIDVLGGLGRRWDHSIANLLLPSLAPLQDCDIRFHYGVQLLFVIQAEAERELRIDARFSLIPLGGDAIGVRTQGLRYPLNGETLFFGRSRGVSNVVENSPVKIDLDSGTLLCVLS